MPRKPHSDREEYWKFTGPMRVSKAVHTLQGLLQGINLDGHVSESEFAAVRHWMAAHAALTRRAPFSEIAEILNEAISDGCLDGDEIEDILYVCKRLEPQSAYFQGVTAEMRTLQGVLAGVVADGIVTDDEIGQLSEWINNNCHMKGCWPYDEIESLLLEVRRDKSIDDRERALLLTFLSEFTTIFGKYAIDFPINELSKPISGLCAVCPEVTFTGKLFCFTGSSKRLKRKELADLVGKLGGSFHPRVTSDVHYLVIGGDGNPCWAFRDCFKTPQLADEPH